MEDKKFLNVALLRNFNGESEIELKEMVQILGFTSQQENIEKIKEKINEEKVMIKLHTRSNG